VRHWQSGVVTLLTAQVKDTLLAINTVRLSGC